MDNDAYMAYDSYSTIDDPSDSVGTAAEVCDGTIRCGSTSGDLDEQLFLDQIYSLASESTYLKRDVSEKDKTTEILKDILAAAEAGAASTATATPPPVTPGSILNTELELCLPVSHPMRVLLSQ